MNLMKNRDAVLEHFRKELSKDRTKTYLVEISPLGLVEMTRQNVSEGVREILTSTCRSCEGRGVTVSAETHAIEVERAVVDLAVGLGDDIEAVAIETQPDVARVLAGNQGKQVELNKRTGKTVRVFGDPDLTPNTFAVRATGGVAEVEALAEPLLRGTKHKVTIERVDPACEDDGLAMIEGVLVTIIGAGSLVGEERTILIAASAGGRAFATLVKPARRRRRRGGRGRRKVAAAIGASGATVEDEDVEDVEDLEEGEEFEDEEEGEFEDEADAGDESAEDAEDDEDDELTEIPQRLVMLDEDNPDNDNDNEDEEEEEDDGDFEDDEEDEDDDEDLDGDDDDGDDDDGDDDDGSGSDDSSDSSDDDGGSDEAEIDDEDAVTDEDTSLDAASVAAQDDADDRPLARRVPAQDDDEPSIDPDGADSLLTERGVTMAEPVGAAVASTSSSSSQSTGGSQQPRGQVDGSGGQGGGNGQRRRRRGSRGGRNRNRNRSGGAGGSGGGSSSSQGGGSTSSSNG